jgi:hypothetical protein
MSEGLAPRRLPFSWVAIPFTLASACVMVLIAILVVDTPHRTGGMFAALIGMTASGIYLARRTGGIQRKPSISENPRSD